MQQGIIWKNQLNVYICHVIFFLVLDLGLTRVWSKAFAPLYVSM